MGSTSDSCALPEEFLTPLAHVAHRLGAIGRRIHWYREIPSTNAIAQSLADDEVEEGCVVVADAQSAGRGRLGRSWSSPAGAGIYASVVLRPAPHVLPLLTLAAGVAIADGVKAAAGLDVTVKWPNDVYIGGRKLAGILAEAGTSPAGVHHVVLGFGINVMPAAYPPDVAARATSVESELGRPADRGLLLAECLAAFSERYRELQDRAGHVVAAAWRQRAASTFGREVEVEAGGGRHRGVAEDIDEAGALIVRGEAGRIRVVAGDVRWI